jgi:pyruvate-formate lyase
MKREKPEQYVANIVRLILWLMLNIKNVNVVKLDQLIMKREKPEQYVANIVRLILWLML